MSYIKVHKDVMQEIESMRALRSYQFKKIFLNQNIFKNDDRIKGEITEHQGRNFCSDYFATMCVASWMWPGCNCCLLSFFSHKYTLV